MSRGFWNCPYCFHDVWYDDEKEEDHDCLQVRFHLAMVAMANFMFFVWMEAGAQETTRMYKDAFGETVGRARRYMTVVAILNNQLRVYVP